MKQCDRVAQKSLCSAAATACCCLCLCCRLCDSFFSLCSVDFTKSNSWQGERSFNNQSLHTLKGDVLTPYNPYQQVIATLSDVLLKRLDDDCSVPMYGQWERHTALSTLECSIRSRLFNSHHDPPAGEAVLQRFDRAQLTLVLCPSPRVSPLPPSLALLPTRIRRHPHAEPQGLHAQQRAPMRQQRGAAVRLCRRGRIGDP